MPESTKNQILLKFRIEYTKNKEMLLVSCFQSNKNIDITLFLYIALVQKFHVSSFDLRHFCSSLCTYRHMGIFTNVHQGSYVRCNMWLDAVAM